MRFIFLFTCLFAAKITSAQTKTYWSPEQMMKMKNITAVRVSPDGNKVVYALREAIMTSSRSEYVNQLYLTDANRDSAIRLTKGDRNNSNPRWSPDGKWIAFLSNRDEKTNIYILPIAGGESERLTDVKTGVSDFRWSPDGNAIAYTMVDSATEAEEKDKKGKSDWYFMDSTYKQGRLYVLWINEKDTTGKQKVLNLTKENRHISQPDWSPDGKWIVYTHALSPMVNDNVQSDISMVNVATGEVRKVADTKAGESQAHFSPDGKSIAYLSLDDSLIWNAKSNIRIVPFEGGKARNMATSPNEPNQLLGWSSDGKYVYSVEPYHTKNKLFRHSADGKTITEWQMGNKDLVSGIELNSRRTHFSMLIENPSRPADGYVSKVSSFQPVKLTNVNPEIAKYPVPKSEVIKWKSFDGKEIEAILTYPLNYEAGKKYPLVLNIHGGPASVFSENFIAGNNSVYLIATLAEKGIFVLRPNPRGSTGYGMDFRLLNTRDWGGGDYQDLMAGVDHMIKQNLVDSGRMAVMGWSYGGFMSSWIVGHTNRFKAATVGAPVIDLVFQNMTDDIAGFLSSYMRKQPWEDWEIYNKHSPLRYVQNVSTPVLLIHGEADIRVPFSQGVMYYNALKRRNVPVKFLVLPRQPHGPVEPKMQLKVLQANQEWLQHYLLGLPKSF